MSARGGRRAGAGRKKGAATKVNAEARAAAAASGETPLDYMLRVMRDADAKENRRDDMAKAAAPYLHAKLATTELTGKGGGPLQVVISGTDAKL
jgi:hypothetical protein